ncbi:DUF447 family protein [Thermococcus sp. M39]|uniref:DUF447 domain-containing protein n=1 Tax=unclassified Thermococcus TaxID=2627626 RepID=UPI0014394655|nr:MULTISPECIES: DUF447 domain-containing protein [unclassified Thermococcus]NJE08850.1 DUF447 family protein [Thermococcus sp. M39]NJE13511.1 DUF447 family protein [Thermococcus sp. LS2]
MKILELFDEGKVYEVLLVTKSNLTPIGIIRKGNYFYFKLFEGKSFQEIKEHPFGVVHITQDVELLVKAALNIPIDVEFEDAKKIPLRKIKKLSWIEGKIEFEESEIEDELGKSRVLKCKFIPVYGEMVPSIVKPISRADYILLDMAVHLTRLFVATRRHKVDAAQKLYSKIWQGYQEYKRLGGKSELSEKIMGLALISVRWNS